jgi:DNA-binding protein
MELNVARRRLSVISDNNLVEGIDNVNLDGKAEDISAAVNKSEIAKQSICDSDELN